MRKITNLTLPLVPEDPSIYSPPFYVPFRIEPTLELHRNGVSIDQFEFHSETGTRVITPATFNPNGKRLGEIDFSQLVNRRAAVVTIRKKMLERITAEDIDEYIIEADHFGSGEALIIRTGWGDNEKAFENMGEYMFCGPSFTVDGAERLAEILKLRRSDLFGTDCFMLGGNRPQNITPWLEVPVWQRPPWPSAEARGFLRDLPPQALLEDYGSMRSLLRHSLVIAGLINLGQIKTQHVRITALPLFIASAVATPTTVIAEELTS